MPIQSILRDDPLKNRMLLRLPSKTLTDEDCQELMDQSNITLAEIDEWTSHFEFRTKNLTDSEVETYLRRETLVNTQFFRNALLSE